jgi:hypothetical protein
MTNEMPQTPEAVALRLYQTIVGVEGGGPRNRHYHLSTYAECLDVVMGRYRPAQQQPAASGAPSQPLIAVAANQTIDAARKVMGR